MGVLNDLAARGQAVWLDFVDRKFLAEGGLQKLVDQDGLTGVTSNPSIFEKAMGHGDAYDAALAEFDKANPDASTMARYENLAIQDIHVVNLRDSREHPVTMEKRRIYGLVWSPIDGKILFSSARNSLSHSVGDWF